jgi:hypothetical protein
MDNLKADFYRDPNSLYRIPNSPSDVMFIPQPVPWTDPTHDFSHPYWRYLVDEEIDEERKSASVHFAGPRLSMPLMREAWCLRMRARGFPRENLTVTFHDDPYEFFLPAVRAKIHASQTRAVHALPAQVVEKMQQEGFSPQAIGAHKRWAQPREHYVRGHRVHTLESGELTVQTYDATGAPVPLAHGPSYSSLAALRVAIYRGKVPGLPAQKRPAQKPASTGDWLDS